ncbi:hypothetical protein ACFX2F_034977 [Malus domestica]
MSKLLGCASKIGTEADDGSGTIVIKPLELQSLEGSHGIPFVKSPKTKNCYFIIVPIRRLQSANLTSRFASPSASIFL